MSDFYGTAGADDRWQGYANQREELLQHIESNQVPGVLFVSGKSVVLFVLFVQCLMVQVIFISVR